MGYFPFMSQEKSILLRLPHTAKRISLWSLLVFKRFPFTTRESLILLTTAIALVQTVLHFATINNYGFHEDELLYMVLGNHLAWGYIETGPLIAVIGNISNQIFGDSLIAIRIIPAICAGAVVHLTGIVTIRLGGKHFAVLVACTAVAFSPAFLASGALFIPQVFDELFWLLTVYLLVCWIQKPNDRVIYLLGVIIGFGVLLKYTLVLYVLGILVGIAFTPGLRLLFKQRAFYFSILLSFFILLPHLIWQVGHSFPAFAHYRELKETQLNFLYRTDFLVQQIAVNGSALFVWVIGIIYLLRTKRLAQFRFFVISFCIVMLVLALLKGKPYYGFGAYPPLFVIGALGLERWLEKKALIKKLSVLFFLVVPNLTLTTIALPMLPIQTAANVFGWAQSIFGITFPIKWEDQKIHSINQNYADMIGWNELAQKTSALYLGLPPEEKQKTIIYTDGYGIASAMSYYAKYYPLPKVVSQNGSFASWAPKNIDDRFIISFTKDNSDKPLNLKGSEAKRVVTNPFSRLYKTRIEYTKSNRQKL